MDREHQGIAPQRGYLQLGTHVRGELIIGFQIFMWGLLLIYICPRAGDIIPGSTDLPQYVAVKVVMRGDASRLASMCRINPPAHWVRWVSREHSKLRCCFHASKEGGKRCVIIGQDLCPKT